MIDHLSSKLCAAAGFIAIKAGSAAMAKDTGKLRIGKSHNASERGVNASSPGGVPVLQNRSNAFKRFPRGTFCNSDLMVFRAGMPAVLPAPPIGCRHQSKHNQLGEPEIRTIWRSERINRLPRLVIEEIFYHQFSWTGLIGLDRVELKSGRPAIYQRVEGDGVREHNCHFVEAHVTRSRQLAFACLNVPT
jgi:hypothetical protein